MKKSESMIRSYLREDRLLFFAIAAVLLLTICVYPRIPDEVPIHWNWRGEADRWAPKYIAAWLMPAAALGTYFFTLLSLAVDPRRENFERFRSTLPIFRQAGPMLLIGIHIVMVAIWLGINLNIANIAFASVGLLYAILGNYLGRVKPNYMVGIRLPWTLESETVWRKTHRFAGFLWFVGGCSLLLAIFLPPKVAFLYFLAVTSLLVVLPALFAYLTYREEGSRDA